MMTQTKGKIAVTGASGQLGRRVTELLADQVEPSRILALTRTPEKLADLAGRGVDVRFGDFSRPDELAEGLNGVERLLIISTDDIYGNRVEQHAAAVEAAVKAGVAHLVYTSAPAPHASSLAFIREHGATEDLIRQSGIPYTFLRNNFYMEMLLFTASGWVATGEIRGTAPDGKINRVTREDCARAAAAVLAGAGDENMIYNITGPGSVDGRGLAEALSTVAGHEVRYVPISVEEMRADLVKSGFPEPIAAMFVEIDQAIGAGELDVSSTAVRDLTGQEPTGLTEFLAQHASLLHSTAVAD